MGRQIASSTADNHSGVGVYCAITQCLDIHAVITAFCRLKLHSVVWTAFSQINVGSDIQNINE